MTRDEAIQILNTEKKGLERDIELTLCEWEEHDKVLLPAIDMAIEALSAEAIQGEWIDVENEPYCECSVCGAYIENLDDDYAFCPRCGADMRGDKE